MVKINRERDSRVRLPHKLTLLLNSAKTKWNKNREAAIEMVRQAYEMVQQYPEETKYGAIIRILDVLISFEVYDKALEIARESYQEIQTKEARNVLEKAHLLVRIAKIKDNLGEDPSNTIDKGFKVLKDHRDDFPAEYISFSTAVLVPFLQQQGKQDKAIQKLERIIHFVEKKDTDKRLELLLAEATATLADLMYAKNRKKSLKYYKKAYQFYQKYDSSVDKRGEIAVNMSDIYLKSGEAEKALDTISKIKDKVESTRVRKGLLKNELDAYTHLGREEEAKETRSKIQQLNTEK